MSNVVRGVLQFQQQGANVLDDMAHKMDKLTNTARWTALASGITATSATLTLLAPILGQIESGFGKIVSAGLRVEATRLTWKGLLGDMNEAGRRMEEINRFASNAPFTKLGIEEAAIQMQALRRYSYEALTAMGNLAAAFPGRTIQQATEAALGATRMEFDPLERFGIGKADIAREIGIAAEDVHAATAAEVERIWDATVTIIQRKHGTMMTELMQSTSGQITNLQDAINRATEQLGQGALNPTSKGVQMALDQVNQMLADGTFLRAGEALGGAMLAALAALGKIGGAAATGGSAILGANKYVSDWLWYNLGAVRNTPGDVFRNFMPSNRTGQPGGMGDLRFADRAMDLRPAVSTAPSGAPNALPATGGTTPKIPFWNDEPMRGRTDQRGGLMQVVDVSREVYAQVASNYAAALDQMESRGDEWVRRHTAQQSAAYGASQALAQSTSVVISRLLLRENVERMRGLSVVKYVAAQTASALIGGIAQYAMTKAAANIAQAFEDLGNPLTVGHAPAAFAAAAKWSALAGVAGGTAAAIGQGSQRDFDRSGATSSAGGASGAGPAAGGVASNGIRALNAAAGPSSVIYNINVTYQGAVVFGDGGTRDWYRRELLPLLRESREMGELAA